jgi:hypothetical protein
MGHLDKLKIGCRGEYEYEVQLFQLSWGSDVSGAGYSASSMVSGLAGESWFVTMSSEEVPEREATGVGDCREAAVIIPSERLQFGISDDRFSRLDGTGSGDREGKDVRIGVQIMQHLKLSKSGWRQKVEDSVRGALRHRRPCCRCETGWPRVDLSRSMAHACLVFL